jgi:hypothetical protein
MESRARELAEENERAEPLSPGTSVAPHAAAKASAAPNYHPKSWVGLLIFQGSKLAKTGTCAACGL